MRARRSGRSPVAEAAKAVDLRSDSKFWRLPLLRLGRDASPYLKPFASEFRLPSSPFRVLSGLRLPLRLGDDAGIEGRRD